MANMVQSVELLLDAEAEAAVRRQWQLLADAGLPAQHAPHRPHITLAVAARLDPIVERRLEHDLDFEAFPLRIGAVMVFGDRRPILVRLVVPTARLLALQYRIHNLVAGSPGIASNTEPDHWTPHVTLARRVQPDQLGVAINTVLTGGDIEATAVGIRRWDGDHRREWTIAEESTPPLR
jgi:2'-5' RNA ligase